MSLVDIRLGFRAFLLEDPTIAGIVGQRIYDSQLPQGELRTGIVFTEVSSIGDHHMQGPSGLAQSRYQVDAWAPVPDNAADLALAIKLRLDGFRGAFTWGDQSPQFSVPIRGVFFQTARTSYDDGSKLFNKGADYIIVFGERP
jgi:hypothetical protein